MIHSQPKENIVGLSKLPGDLVNGRFVMGRDGFGAYKPPRTSRKELSQRIYRENQNSLEKPKFTKETFEQAQETII